MFGLKNVISRRYVRLKRPKISAKLLLSYVWVLVIFLGNTPASSIGFGLVSANPFFAVDEATGEVSRTAESAALKTTYLTFVEAFDYGSPINTSPWVQKFIHYHILNLLFFHPL